MFLKNRSAKHAPLLAMLIEVLRSDSQKIKDNFAKPPSFEEVAGLAINLVGID